MRTRTTPIHLPRTGIIRHLTATLTYWHTRRRSRLALSRLCPHLLRDVGLSSDVSDAEARRPFWRR